MAKRPTLKGLASRLIQSTSLAEEHPVDAFVDQKAGRVIDLPVSSLQPNPDQPRKHFDPEALEDLTASVREKGLLQPVIARKNPSGEGFLLIAGERRWRAAKAAGLAKIPALIRQEEDALEVALIENLQREALNPLEEAEALLQLKQARRFSDEMLAKVVGKSRQAINDSLRLNQLPEPIKADCRTSGRWTKSQLLQLLRTGSPEKLEAVLEASREGDTPTVRELRKKKDGRPKGYQFSFNPPGRGFRLTLKFSKAKVSTEEVRTALTEALDNLA